MLTVYDLELLNAEYNLDSFDICPTSRRFCKYDDAVLTLRKKHGSIGIVVVEISIKTCKVVKSELQVVDEETGDYIHIKLNKEQLRDINYALI